MDIDQFLLAGFSALIGFLLSQSLNVVRYLRRPKLQIGKYSGILSTYSGFLPEEPAEVEIGFHIENQGKEPATGVKLYLLNIETTKTYEKGKESLEIDTIELKLQSQFIGPDDAIVAKVATIDTFKDFVCVNSDFYDEHASPFWQIEADTRGKRWFKFKIFVQTDRDDASLLGEFEVEIDEDDVHPKYSNHSEDNGIEANFGDKSEDENEC